jgi:hypothetical protein
VISHPMLHPGLEWHGDLLSESRSHSFDDGRKVERNKLVSLGEYFRTMDEKR